MTNERGQDRLTVILADIFVISLIIFFVYITNIGIKSTVVYIKQKHIPPMEISIQNIPLYSLYSLFRLFSASLLSLVFTIVYGYISAKVRKAENLLIPILDVLQSVPVASIFPGITLFLVSNIHNTYLALELTSIFLIFTGQVWNMTFSFYQSLKMLPNEFTELSKIYRLGPFKTIFKIEIPYTLPSLIWNTIMSFAGGWFFISLCEYIVLGEKLYILPGLGSFVRLAIEQNKTKEIVAGTISMVLLLILVDRIIWKPLLIWSQDFKLEMVKSPLSLSPDDSLVYRLIRASRITKFFSNLLYLLKKRIYIKRFLLPKFQIPENTVTVETFGEERKLKELFHKLISLLPTIFIYILVIYLSFRFFHASFGMIASVGFESWIKVLVSGLLTFLRVLATVVISSVIMVPLGVYIGMNPNISKRVSGVIQLLSAFPYPMLYPLLADLFVKKMHISPSILAVFLMLFGSQWYILYNTIAGASKIPSDFVEMSKIFALPKFYFWFKVIIPTIFSDLVTGWLTAYGGAWNTSIVAEYIPVKDEIIKTDGLGALIMDSAENLNFPLLTVSTLTMIFIVVIVNNFIWKRLYRYSEENFKLT